MSEKASNNTGLAAVPDEAKQVLLGEKSQVQAKLGPVAQFSSNDGNSGQTFVRETTNELQTNTPKQDAQFLCLNKQELQEYIKSAKWQKIRRIIAGLYFLVIIALLVGSVLLIIYSPRCPPKPSLAWYQSEIIYEVDVTTFYDSNADGVGDFKGLKEKLDYLEENRIKSVLLQSTIFNQTISSSTKLDGKDSLNKKYDLYSLDPAVGSDAEFQDLLKALGSKNSHVIIDLPISSTFDPQGISWYGSSKPLKNTIQNPCSKDSKSIGCSYYTSYGRLPLNFNQTEVYKQSELRLIHWLGTKKCDGVRVDLPLEIDSSGNYKISYQTIELWQSKKREIEAKSKQKLLFFDIPSDFYESIQGKKLHNDTAHPLYLTKLTDSTSINAEHLADRLKFGGLSRPQFWKLGSKRRSDDIGIVSETALPREMVLTILMLIGGTPTLLYGDELGLDQKTSPLMAWNSDPPFGGFSACSPDVCKNLRANSATKANVKRQKAAGGQTQDSLLKVFRRLAVLRQQNSFLFSGVRMFFDNEKNLFCFVREAIGFPGFVVALNLKKNEELHVSLHDLTEKIVPVHVHYEYQWPKAHFPESKSEHIDSDNLVLDPYSINIFSWREKLVKSNPLFSKTSD